MKTRKGIIVFSEREFFKGAKTNKIEQKANEFALELLMPTNLFEKQISLGNNTIVGLANYFCVCTYHVIARGKMLGYIG